MVVYHKKILKQCEERLHRKGSQADNDSIAARLESVKILTLASEQPSPLASLLADYSYSRGYTIDVFSANTNFFFFLKNCCVAGFR